MEVKDTEGKIETKNRFLMIAFPIIIAFFNFFILRFLYNDKKYFFLLLTVVIQMFVYFYIHFTLKDKVPPQNLLEVKIITVLSTILLEFLFFSVYLNNVLFVYDGESKYLL